MKRPIKPAVVVIAVTVAIISLSGLFFGPDIAKWIHPVPPVEAQIAEPSYFDTLKAVDSDSETAFLTDGRLIDTHTPYPIPSDSPLSMQALLDCGEICGVRLGMSMSEVVRLWGKPTSIVGWCGIGPRMWYAKPGGMNYDDGISLRFRGDRLEEILVWGTACEELAFDDGITGKMAREDIARLIGEPLESHSQARMNEDSVVYIHRDIRLDLRFHPSDLTDDNSRVEMEALAVRFKERPTILNSGKPPEPANSIHPTQTSEQDTAPNRP